MLNAGMHWLTIYCYLCCWIMWSCYWVHSTSCLCTLSASAFMLWAMHPYISYRFIFRHLFVESYFCSFLINIFLFVMRCRPRTRGLCIRHPRTCSVTNKWRPTLCPLSLPCKKSQECSKEPSKENFLATGCYFEHNTYMSIMLRC